VIQFSFGCSTPHIKDVHAYECVDRVGGGKRPVSWSTVMHPAPMQSHLSQLLLQAHVTVQSDDFSLVLHNCMAGKWCDFEYSNPYSQQVLRMKIKVNKTA